MVRLGVLRYNRGSMKHVEFKADAPRRQAIAPQPTLIVDTREIKPLQFTHLGSVRGTLQSGDYSALGLTDVFAVERKTMPDLVQSLRRDRARFMRELHRLRGFAFARLLLVGTRQELIEECERRQASLLLIELSLLSIEQRFGVKVARVDTPAEAALQVEAWAFAAWRDAAAKMSLYLPFPRWISELMNQRRGVVL